MFPSLFSFIKRSPITMVPITLGTFRFEIPVAELTGRQAGKTILITAGMDGDEYAGIEAAYQLIERLKDKPLAGKVIIIPIVNMPGFEDECSQNPLDQRFPKYYFPGSQKGSHTHQLIHWLNTTYIQQADVWYDMHGGAITEGLYPFLWFYKTGHKTVDAISQHMIESHLAETIVYEPVSRLSKAGHLAHQGKTYILAESGSRGERKKEDVDRHLYWVETLLHQTQVTTHQPEGIWEIPTIYTTVDLIQAPFDGIWNPASAMPKKLTKGHLLGTYQAYNNLKPTQLFVPTAGIPLWWKETMRMKKGDVLCALARK